MYQYKAKLIRIIDGDTIEAVIDLGFEIGTRKTIRLYGINAPETRGVLEEEKKAGIKCKDRLEALLEASKGEFKLISHGVGKFGRCLGELFVKNEEISLNQQLINEGLAKKYEK
jgi:micrococcal nuclease